MGIVFTGAVLQQLGLIEVGLLLEIGEQYRRRWWLAPLITPTGAALYAVALPGSVLYILAGLLFKPFYATVMIVAGGVLGGMGGYCFSRFMSARARKRLEALKAFAVLQKHGDFSTLCAYFPNFPSIINYGAGILNIALPRFIITTAFEGERIELFD